MLSYQIKAEVENILSTFGNANYFVESIRKIDSTFPELDKYIQQIAEGGDKATQSAKQLRNQLAQVKTAVAEISPRMLFSSMDSFLSELKKAQQTGFDDLSQLESITHQLDSFSKSYESYIRSYTPQSAGSLIAQARALLSLLDGFQKGLNIILANYEADYSDWEDGRELSLVLTGSISLSEFIRKLQAVEKLYKEICLLTEISISDHPIRIIKIESGSLWIKILGSGTVIALLTGFIESSAEYVYRNYTDEGKLTAMPRKIETLDSILDLSKKMEAEGINTKEIKENLAKSAVIISKELNAIIDGQAEVIINQNKFSVGNEVQKKLIGLKEPLRLEYNEDQSNNDK